MEKYRPKTPLAAFSDKLLRALLAAGAGIGWFVTLWGLSLPALAAGLAMGGLIWLCARLFGKKKMQKKEQTLRRMLGGELALEKLLVMKPSHGALLAALWIAPKAPIELERAADFGVLGTLRGQRVLVRLAARHKSSQIGVQEVIDSVKECRAQKAERCFFCVTAPMSREAVLYAEEAEPPIRVVTREELTALAGLRSPATDEELARLGRRRGRRPSARERLQEALQPGRARRYLWYGAGLAGLALLSGQGFYALPALVCFGLLAGCKLREQRRAQDAGW